MDTKTIGPNVHENYGNRTEMILRTRTENYVGLLDGGEYFRSVWKHGKDPLALRTLSRVLLVVLVVVTFSIP